MMMDFNAALLTEPRFVTGTVSTAAINDVDTGDAIQASHSGYACTGIALAAAPKAKAYGNAPAADNVALQVMGVAAVNFTNAVQQSYAARDATFGFAQGFGVNALGTTLGEHRTLLHPIYQYPFHAAARELMLFYDSTTEWDHYTDYHPDDVSTLFTGRQPTAETARQWKEATKGAGPDPEDITGGSNETDKFAKLGYFKDNAPAAPSTRIRKVQNCTAYSTDTGNVDITEKWDKNSFFSYATSAGDIKYAYPAPEGDVREKVDLVHGAISFKFDAYQYKQSAHKGAQDTQYAAFTQGVEVNLIARNMTQGWRFYHYTYGTPVYFHSAIPKCVQVKE